MTNLSFIPESELNAGPSPYEVVANFLSRIDPEDLESAVLDRMGWGDKGTMGVALQILMEEAADELQH